MWRVAVSAIAGSITLACGVGGAAELKAGEYLCTVSQRAGIGSTHHENAPPPAAFLEKQVRHRFKIAVSKVAGGGTVQYRIAEIAYSGPDAGAAVWQTENSVLHSVYVGDGVAFTAIEDQAFLRIGNTDPKARRIWFYHAGFEYPGGEDTNLTVRSGTCVQEK